jgi:hypothetical protein
MLRISIIAFIVALFVLPAWGQSTQPTEKTAKPAAAEQAWPRQLESLAKALAKGDPAEVAPMFATRAAIHGFESRQLLEVSDLLQSLANSTLVGQHAYLHPPLAMAADIAADFKNAASIGEKEKAKFLVEDEHDMKLANSTAVQWVAEQLGARAAPIGVIVLWTPRLAPAGSTGEDATVYDALFVLCRGEEITPNEFKITAAVFGNPIPQQDP